MTVILVAACLAVSFPASAVAPLSLNLEVGAKYTYKSVEESVFGSGDLRMTAKVTTVVTYEVVSLVAGRYQMKETTDSFLGEVPDEYELDSSIDYTGQVLTFSVGKDRTFRDWQLAETGEMSEELIEATKLTKRHEESLGLQSLVFPKGELTVGTTWSIDTLPPLVSSDVGTVESEGELTVEYKVIGFEDRGKRIVIEASIDDSYRITIDFGGQVLTTTSEVDEARKIWVEIATGMIVKVESEIDRVMITDFREFATETKLTIELTKRS